MQELRDIPLRSDNPVPPETICSEHDGFITPNFFVALAAHETSNDQIWFGLKKSAEYACVSLIEYAHISKNN